MFSFRFDREFALMAAQVLTANNVGCEDILLWMSLTYMRNKSCPSGTPYEIYSVVDEIWLSVTYCFLSVRYELNRSCA